MSRLLTRNDFRERVFERDGYRCVFCNRAADETPEGKLDAHHIIERRLFTAVHELGGYFVDNGVTVCEDHHKECEATTITCDDVRDAAGISKIILPSYFYNDQPVDKWGNPIMANGMRLKGPLFYDESVQKIISPVLHLFSKYVKYPRTSHLPWSAGIHSDDRVIETLDHFIGQEVVATVKNDGENTTVYNDYLHARAIDGLPHASRNWVKNFAANWQHALSDDQRICGENMFAQHSIVHDENNPLPDYFLGFSMWDGNTCLAWDETLENFEILGITPTQTLWRGVFDENAIKALYDEQSDWNTREGYVVRLTNSFTFDRFKYSVAKYVRANHVQTLKHHWRAQKIVPNFVGES